MDFHFCFIMSLFTCMCILCQSLASMNCIFQLFCSKLMVLCWASVKGRSLIAGDSNMDAKHQKCKWCRRCAATVWVKARLSRVVQSINNMVTDIFFDLFINFCIVLNTIVMSLEHHGMGDNLRQLISITSMVGAVVAETFLFHCSQFFILYVMISVSAVAQKTTKHKNTHTHTQWEFAMGFDWTLTHSKLKLNNDKTSTDHIFTQGFELYIFYPTLSLWET